MIERGLQAKARNLGEGNVVRFLGLPSEGAALVAASSPEPVVAADLGGLRKIVGNGVTGFLVRRAQSEFSHERFAAKTRKIIIGVFARRPRL